jgi:hypothetical protein
VTKQYTVRLASEQDAAKLAEWLIKTPNNLFDPDIAQYPNLRVLVVEKDGEPIIYFPFHVVFQGESLALKPDADKKHLAHGFRVLENALLALAEPTAFVKCSRRAPTIPSASSRSATGGRQCSTSICGEK